MIEVFGWTAAAIGLAVGIPQLIRILRSGTSAGVSLRLWQLNAATTVSWAVHGVLTDTPQMQVPNLSGAVVAVGIVLFVCRDRRQPFLVQLVLPLLVAVALSSVDIFLGAVAFGLIVAVPQLIGQFAQTRDLLFEPDLTGVSVVFLLVFCLIQTMWWIFGIVQLDWALIICAGLMVLSTVANVIIYAVRRMRAARSAAAVALAR